MKQSAPVCLILTCFFTGALFRCNRYVAEEKTWQEARNYCVENYTDLTSIWSQEEDDDLWNYPGREDRVWIGLFKDGIDNWKWVGGQNVTFSRWLSGPFKDGAMCAVHRQDGWRNLSCTKTRSFFCSDRCLVLVKENKTWEEAMKLCRDQNRDLVSLPSGYALSETLVVSQGAQTDLVWTGLRYLADRWLWVSGETQGYWHWNHPDALQCPGWIHRCGALSLKGNYVVAWDCAAKLNFVCNKRNRV
ncbi:FRAS1-related extracellular matrix protein 1 [Liparis tanakae]|uniref:FRAS1-related extracellular matrix protein 1 n=1 Tax=Liparis tanakae TaxID=230148 RepID=A0A4Z2E051_9TELE|nr:FRAS1-related extracellular matrix protein 1 [Liparis tanakae]